MNQPINQAATYPVHCCVCMNTTGEKVAANWLLPSGYVVCEAHVDSSIEELERMVWKRGEPA